MLRSNALLVCLALSHLGCGPTPPGRRTLDASVEPGEPGPGPAVGAALPAFELYDQDGRLRSFESLRGPNGLLLNFNRSVVW